MKKGLILIIVLLFLAFVGLSTLFNCSLSGQQTVDLSVRKEVIDSSDKI